MIVKIHEAEKGKKLVAICDSNLLGKKFEEGNLQLDLCSGFYKGEEKGPEEVKKIIKGAYIVNIVGEESIAFCVDLGLVEEDKVLTIGGVPHAEVVIVND